MSRRTVTTEIIKRANIALLALLGVFLVLLIRIFLLQTIDFQRYQNIVINQLTTESTVSAERGIIYDCNGNVLATNITTYRVFISPSGIQSAQRELNDEYGENAKKLDQLIASGLAGILGEKYEDVLKQTTYTKYLDRTIKRNVDEETADIIRAFIDENDLESMIYLEANSTRYYPYGSLASHVLGFTSSDGQGLYGLELQYNKELEGVDGKYVTARDSYGNEMPYKYESYIEAIDGYRLNSTIDVYVQSVLEEELQATLIESGAKNRACGIVMNVNTGAILGMAVAPSFDLNDPWEFNDYYNEKLKASGFSEGSDEYSALSRELLLEMWSNKVLTDSYIPGSTFKIVTASMALEEKLFNISDKVYCSGSLLVSGHHIHCHKTTGHGILTFAEALQQSCNPWLMTMGLKIGSNNFYRYFNAFGYNERTGIDLPGEGGSIIRRDMTELDLAIYSFGQNFNVTAIQQICAAAAVANGGKLVTPHMIESITDESGNVIYKTDTAPKRSVISSETSKTIADILEKGVSGDGGAKNAYVPGYRVAAKTGTSEKKGSSEADARIGSCLGFAPADNPQYAVIIIVDEPTYGSRYGSVVAAPYISNVMEKILPYLGVEAVYTEEELAKMSMSVPNYQYMGIENAKYYAELKGFNVEIVGDGSYVKSQMPTAGSVVEKVSGKIIFYTGSSKPTKNIEVPDVVGKTAAAANSMLVNAGLNIKIEGAKNYLSGVGATVISQSPAAGSVVSAGSVITVEFRHLDKDEDFE